MQIDADVAKHCRPWPLGGWVHKLARMHKTIHTEVRSSWHVIVNIHRLARVHKTPYTPKAVECRTRRKARQAVKETIHVWLQDRQPPGRHRTVVQWLPNGSVSKRADCWEVHTGQVSLFNTVAIGLPNSCVMNAGLWTWKSQSTCQLVPAVQSFVKYQLSQVVSLWDMLFNLETYCLMLSHTSHKFTAKKPMTRLQALSCSVKTVSEIECLLADRLSNFETYCLILRHASHKITVKTLVTRLHTSSLIFRQDNQWARMSNFETGCPTSRHTVWSWDMPHTRLLPRRPWQDCMQVLSSFSKNVNEQIVWLWDRAAAMWKTSRDLALVLSQLE